MDADLIINTTIVILVIVLLWFILDLVDLVKNGFSNHISNIIIRYEKARIYFYTNPNLRDADTSFYLIGDFR